MPARMSPHGDGVNVLLLPMKLGQRTMKRDQHALLIDTVLTEMGALGIVAMFAPFDTGDDSLYSVLSDGYLWVLGTPFVLAIPIFLVSVRWLKAGRLPRTVIAQREM